VFTEDSCPRLMMLSLLRPYSTSVEWLSGRPSLLSAGLVLGTLALVSPAGAQTSSDIFVAELSVANGVVRITPPVNVTVRPAYDNQPQFTTDGRAILYTAMLGDGQTDIFRYDLSTRTLTQVTRTPESEYSPTPLPGGGIAAVRVEADSVQRLWRFDEEGGGATLLVEDVAPVGYFAFGDAQRVALYVLGSPARLVLAELHSGVRRTVAEDIARTLQKVPGRGSVSFVQRIEDGRRVVVELDMATGRLGTVAQALPNGDYHAWTPHGHLLMSQGAKLYQWGGGRDRRWREILDLSARGIDITRIAVSPAGDRIAIVGEPRS
jgi:hypothetical protein